eukprot:g44791.t1
MFSKFADDTKTGGVVDSEESYLKVQKDLDQIGQCTEEQQLELNLVHRLISICNQIELTSGAKINQGKSEAKFFGNWADRSFIPFIVRADYLKVLGIWQHEENSYGRSDEGQTHVAVADTWDFTLQCWARLMKDLQLADVK